MGLFLPLVALALVALYFIYFAPPKPKASPTRSVEYGPPQPNGGKMRRNVLVGPEGLSTSPLPGVNTIGELFRSTVERFGSRQAIGFRNTVRVVDRETTIEKDGVQTKKVLQIPWKTPYHFMTFDEAYDQVTRIGAAVVELGVQPGQMVSIFSNTRCALSFAVLLLLWSWWCECAKILTLGLL